MTKDVFSPIHPGEILLEEFLKELDISRNQLGRDLGIPPQRINQIRSGETVNNYRYSLASLQIFQYHCTILA